MKIYIDAYLDNNIGDDLMVMGLLEKYPDYNFFMSTENSVVEKTYAPYNNLKFIETNEYKEIYKEFDVYLKIGGSIFQFFSIRDTIRRYYNYLKLKKLKKNNVKIITLGSNLGPFNSEISKKVARKEISICDFITVRDKESYNLIRNEFKLDNVFLFDDIVFELLPQFNKKDKSFNDGIINLGISTYRSVRNKKINYNMYDNLYSIIKKLPQAGEQIKVFLFAFDTEDENDLSAAHHLKYLLEEKKIDVEIIPYLGKNKLFFLRKFSAMDYIIAVRFHAAILSDIYNIPYLPVAYSNKLTNYIIDDEVERKKIKIEEFSDNSNFNIKFSDFKNRTKVVETGHLNQFSQFINKNIESKL